MSAALPDAETSAVPEPPAAIVGDRGPAWVKRGASVQAKVQNGLALAVVALLGGGFLAWYYSRVAAEPEAADQARAQAAAQGEMKLPSLMRLKESRRVPMWNGPIECRLFRFDMVAGSNKEV